MSVASVAKKQREGKCLREDAEDAEERSIPVLLGPLIFRSLHARNASNAANFFPAMNSSIAPPPVLTKE